MVITEVNVMRSFDDDKEYWNKVNDILEHDEFKKMEDIVHHGITRYNHSVRVSYYSYRIAKFLRLDSELADKSKK